MIKKLILVVTLLFYTSITIAEHLINHSCIENLLMPQAHWAGLHDAKGDYLGTGMLYYALVYASCAKLCVCLGSGDGFVPRIMRQAQRDLLLPSARTILVDGNIGAWGRPLWLNEQSFFRTQYPDIEIIIDTTKHVAETIAKTWQIDYLHIDADRTPQGALQDFLDYLPFMTKPGIISLHDTGAGKPCAQTVELIRELGHNVVNFEHFGTGVALIVLS